MAGLWADANHVIRICSTAFALCIYPLPPIFPSTLLPMLWRTLAMWASFYTIALAGDTIISVNLLS